MTHIDSEPIIFTDNNPITLQNHHGVVKSGNTVNSLKATHGDPRLTSLPLFFALRSLDMPPRYRGVSRKVIMSTGESDEDGDVPASKTLGQKAIAATKQRADERFAAIAAGTSSRRSLDLGLNTRSYRS